jgi:hypothetical protein
MRVTTQATAKKPWLRRIWLVLTDHSVGGVWRTKREATAAMELRQGDHSLTVTEFAVVGPYVLQPRGGK